MEFDSNFPCGPSRGCLPQPGITNPDQYLDILSYRQRPTHRLAYRNFKDYEALVTQSIEATAGTAGMRWYEVRRNEAGTYSIYQQGNVAPVTASTGGWARQPRTRAAASPSATASSTARRCSRASATRADSRPTLPGRCRRAKASSSTAPACRRPRTRAGATTRRSTSTRSTTARSGTSTSTTRSAAAAAAASAAAAPAGHDGAVADPDRQLQAPGLLI